MCWVRARGLREKAIRSGANKIYIDDLREEFVRDFILPTVRRARYERKCLLGTSFARPHRQHQVMVAEQEGADAVAGATGKGNDQVRFELTYKALNPRLKVIAPWRGNLSSARTAFSMRPSATSLHVTAKIFAAMATRHLSHEGGNLEDPGQSPEDMFVRAVSPGGARR